MLRIPASSDRYGHAPSDGRRRGRHAVNATASLALLLLSGCAGYHPAPLPSAPDLMATVPRVEAGRLRAAVPGLPPHAIDPGRPLDMNDVAILAVWGNPDLAASRLKRGIAGAEVFAAGLLPDPQVSLSLDHPTSNGPGLTDAFGLGATYDLQSLVLHGAKLDAARAAARKVDLEVLWQEWQVIQQARTLTVELVEGRRKLALLQRQEPLYARRYRSSSAAMARGDLTLEVAGSDLTGLLDVQSQAALVERQVDTTRHELNALLGLAPDIDLNLAALPVAAALPRPVVDAALGSVAARRPDLLALRAGYDSQEAAVRQAILAQFPSLSVGLTRARDTSNVHTLGVTLNFSLPFLNGGKGEIAVQQATRANLRQEYQARLDQTTGEVDRLWQQQRLFEAQAKQLAGFLPSLVDMVQHARQAYRSQDIPALAYLNLETTMLQKQLETIDLDQSQWTTRIAIETLLGWPDGTQAAAGPTSP